MGRKALPKKRILDPETREKWLQTLLPYFLKNGFRRVTMNDITRQLGISKATLYEHFQSRDELYSESLELLLKQVGDARVILDDQSLSYEDRFLRLFGVVLRQVIGISPILLEDMKYHYPALWQRVQEYYQDWERTLHDFFKEAMEAGAFQKVHPALISRVITSLLREFMNPEFLMQNQITVEQAFTDMLKLLSEGFLISSESDPEALKEKVRDIIIGSMFYPPGTNFMQTDNRGEPNEKMD